MRAEGFKIEPLYDHVIVKRASNNKSAGGILLPEAMKDRAKEGVVVAVGPGFYINGELISTTLVPGDKVYVREFYGNKIDFEGEEYFTFKENEILGKIVDNT